MTFQDKQRWSEVLKETFKTFGYSGNVNIENGETPDEYWFYHDSFENPFRGFFPKGNGFFTVQIVEHPVRLPDEDFLRIYREAFVFDRVMMTPLFYSIYQEPEFQRVMITNTKDQKAGDIYYHNRCSRNGYKSMKMDKLIFPSEVFDLEEVIRKLS